jgi:hypothetical protein
MEVVFQAVAEPPRPDILQAAPVEIFRDIPQPHQVELLPKMMDPRYDFLEGSVKVTKPSVLTQNVAKMVRPLDMSLEEKRIEIPVFQSEKITNPKYLNYNQSIREKIRAHAYQFIDNPEFTGGEVYLTFVVASDGRLRNLKVLEHRTHATEFLRQAGVKSVKAAQPFDPFPEGLSFSELTFNVVISFQLRNDS